MNIAEIARPAEVAHRTATDVLTGALPATATAVSEAVTEATPGAPRSSETRLHRPATTASLSPISHPIHRRDARTHRAHPKSVRHHPGRFPK
jgi:hypothetical protein